MDVSSSTMNIETRLRAWSPTMPEYHANPALSSGFLADMSDGLSTAFANRRKPFERPIVQSALAIGSYIHAELCQDHTVRTLRSESETRYTKEWKRDLVRAKGSRFDIILPISDLEVCHRMLLSLRYPAPMMDTDAKRHIRNIFTEWRRWPEVSHVWTPSADLVNWPAGGEMFCRIREDLIALSPNGKWCTFQVKTTRESLRTWWRFWRRWYLRGAALYQKGLEDLFGEVPFEPFLIVARTVEPYQWGLFSLRDFHDEINKAWYTKVAPRLVEVSEAMLGGRWYGPEERGMLS